jgi:hypothetical protein
MAHTIYVPELEKNRLLLLTHFAAVVQGFETLIAGNSITFMNGDLCIHMPIINGLAEYPVRLSVSRSRNRAKCLE